MACKRSSQEVMQQRKDVVESFLKLLTDASYKQVTMDAIAGISGYGRTTVYRLFKTKKAIFHQLFEDPAEGGIVTIKGADDTGGGQRFETTTLFLIIFNPVTVTPAALTGL